MRYLFDTNACIGYLRGHALLTRRIRACPISYQRLCSVVKAELIGGTLRSRRPAVERARVDAFMQQYVSLPFDDIAAEVFARLTFSSRIPRHTHWPL